MSKLLARMYAEDAALQRDLADFEADVEYRRFHPRQAIRDTIRNYLKGSPTISAFTLQCFVGMVETGEATLQDFESVGGVAVRQLVRENLES